MNDGPQKCHTGYPVEVLELLIGKVAYTKYDATGLVRWSDYSSGREGTVTASDLHEEVGAALKSRDIPTQTLAELVTEGAPSMAGRDIGRFSLNDDTKNTTNRPFDDMTLLDTPLKSVCKFPEDDECCYSELKHVNFIRSKVINHQSKHFLSDVESKMFFAIWNLVG
jgi:hypothetical protein